MGIVEGPIKYKKINCVKRYVFTIITLVKQTFAIFVNFSNRL